MFTKEEILTAIEKAAKGHMRKTEVRRMLADKDRYAATILADIADGSYHQKIEYRQLERTGNNGKRRKILSPSLYTRVLQLAWMNAVIPLYNARDNLTGLNCKQGCGITANVRHKSTLHQVKHLMYDRRDLHYGLVIDQRKCYDHITRRAFRRKMKRLTGDKWLIGYDEIENGLPTGKTVAREFHGNYSCLIKALEAWEQTFGRTSMLPIEEVQIENQCGYIFRGSTNQIKYIEDYEHQQSDCA